MGPDLPRRRSLDIGDIYVAARYYLARKTSATADEKPLPLAGGVGEGSQRPNERFRAQVISRAKIN